MNFNNLPNNIMIPFVDNIIDKTCNQINVNNHRFVSCKKNTQINNSCEYYTYSINFYKGGMSEKGPHGVGRMISKKISVLKTNTFLNNFLNNIEKTTNDKMINYELFIVFYKKIFNKYTN